MELYEDDLDFMHDEVYRRDENGFTPVHWIIQRRAPVTLLNLVIKKCDDWLHVHRPAKYHPHILSLKDNRGYTCLHFAALFCDNLDVMRRLIRKYPLALNIKAGFDVESFDMSEFTPLEIFKAIKRPELKTSKAAALLKVLTLGTNAVQSGDASLLFVSSAPPPTAESFRRASIAKNRPPPSVNSLLEKLKDVSEKLEEAQKELDAERRCCICWSNDKSVIFKPCMHRACCATCSSKVSRCPLCRVRIKGRIHIVG